MDYELAAMKAVPTVLGPHVHIHGCFYHLTQTTWRKIQSLGLVQRYRNDEEFKLFCGMLDGLAFLPVDEVQDGMEYLKTITPEGLEPLLDYFDNTYVSGVYRHIQAPPLADGTVPAVRFRRHPPTYSPSIWNVHDITLNGGSRTNNICEGWNNSFTQLVGHAHPAARQLIDVNEKKIPYVLSS